MYKRSFHFIPADKQKLFAKIPSLNADAFIFDIEDGVAKQNKAIARQNVLNFFDKNKNTNNFWIRINPIDTEEFLLDAKAFKNIKNISVVVPKLEKSQDINLLIDKGLNIGKVIGLIESFKGLNNLANIVKNKHLYALGLGLEDMLCSFYEENSYYEKVINGIKLQTVFYAKANDIFVIDGISYEFNNELKLKNHCLKSKSYGIDAMFCIHPFQINTINNAFSISNKMVKWALNIKSKCNLKSEFGYTKVDGELITPPKIKKAITILSKVGLLNEKE